MIHALSETQSNAVTLIGSEDLNKEWLSFRTKILNYRNSIKDQESYCLSLERVGDFEDYAYWHLGVDSLDRTANLLGTNVQKLRTDLWKKIVIENPIISLKLTLIHYVNFFCVASPIQNKVIEKNIPLLSKSAFGPEDRPFIVFMAFQFLGFLFFITSAFYFLVFMLRCLKVYTFRIGSFDQIAANLILWCHGYMIFVAVFSISNPRYLMLIFPLIVFSISLFIHERFTSFFKSCVTSELK